MDFNTIKKMLEGLANDEGLTLKKAKPVTYKTGYQVASDGIEAHTIADAIVAVLNFNGNCGVWLSNNIFYIDNSHHIQGKKKAIQLGYDWKQLSIFDWKKQTLIWM